jgi:2-methylisocitrate lyase-like PEP mutase family enzyme
VAQALRSHGGQEGGARRAHGGEDQGYHGRAAFSGDADLRAYRRARGARAGRALRRAERYIRAGAEAIFVEAPESVEELKLVAESFDVPQFANPLVGGRTPLLSPKEFEQLGFRAICFGLETIMHAAKAMQLVLDDMRSGRFALRDKGMSFEEFKAVVHYERWDRIDNLYGVQA